MAWSDVPAKITKYDALTYADDSQGTTASSKLIASYGVSTIDDIPIERQEEFEADLDYRIGACENLDSSKALPFKTLRDLT